MDAVPLLAGLLLLVDGAERIGLVGPLVQLVEASARLGLAGLPLAALGMAALANLLNNLLRRLWLPRRWVGYHPASNAAIWRQQLSSALTWRI